MVENTLKEILEELKGINEKLHTIASNMESGLESVDSLIALAMNNAAKKYEKHIKTINAINDLPTHDRS